VALSAIGGTAVGGFISYLLQRQQFQHERNQLRMEHKTEFMAEETARKLLAHESHYCRRFSAISNQIGGYEEDELRKILVRSGAVRVDRGDDDEWWMLLSREKDYIQSVRERKGRN